MSTEDYKNTQDDEQGNGKEWQAIAEQMASHSTTNDKGETVYLGQDLPEDQQAKVIERGFDNPAEEPRGATDDSTISEETYPQLDGESQEDYERRLAELQGLTDLAAEDAKMEDESRLAGKLGSVGIAADDGKKSELDPFWKEHEDTFKEAEELGAPLDAETFEKEDYKLMRDPDDGKVHVWAPTPEYKDWQKNGERGVRPKHYEGLEDRRAKEELDERERAFKEGLGKFKENGEELSSEAVEYVYGYYCSIKGPRDKKNIEAIREQLHEVFDDKENFIEAYAEALLKAFSKDRVEAQNKDIAKGMEDFFSAPWWMHSDHDIDIAYRVGRTLIRLKCDGDSLDVSKNISKEDEEAIKLNTARTALSEGSFFPKTFRENPQDMDGVLDELGLDKNNEELVLAAIEGYGGENDGAEIDYFDLKNKVAELIYTRGVHFVISKDGKKLWYEYQNNIISPEVSERALAEIAEASGKVTERLREELESGELVEKACAAKIEKEKEELAQRVVGWNTDEKDFDFEHYLDTKVISVSLSDSLKKPIEDAIKEEPLRRFLSVRRIYEGLGIQEDAEAKVDFRETIRESLLERLRQGMGKVPTFKEWEHNGYMMSHYGERDEYLTKIFETESFKKNQERLGIDFSDPTIAEISFEGFLKTLSSANGEYSAQANWYYTNIFANDPGKFISMMKAYRESDECSRGMKAKMTRFFKNNPLAFEDKIRQEVNERAAKEINGEHRAIKTSVLRHAARGDIKKIIDDYKKDIIEKAQNKATGQTTTFTGPKTIVGVQPETGSEDRKETPFDFGLEKAYALERYADFIEANLGCNVSWFTDTFPQGNNDTEIFERSDSYIGFQFEYEGHLCVIAESLNQEAAMYLWRGEPGQDFKKELFDLSKFDAKRSNNPSIANVNHLDKEHFDESLDESYQKAFIFFRTGDKRDLFYGEKGSQEDWRQYQDQVFPAWPMGIDGYTPNPRDLRAYREWQERQDIIKTRLQEAMERGGQRELDAERRRIADEEYERLAL